MKIIELTESMYDLNKEKISVLLNNDFSESFERFKKGEYFFKGFDSFSMQKHNTLAYYGSPLKNRRSKNTLNYYTLWINNHSDWKEFPKRNFIFTNSLDVASGYGSSSGTMIILPKNGSKIGVVPARDIWFVFRFNHYDMFDTMQLIRDLLKTSKLNNSDSCFDTFINSLDKFQINKDVEQFLENESRDLQILFKSYSFYQIIRNLFSPNKGFELKNVKDAPSSDFIDGSELWMDDDFLAIPYEKLEEFKKIYVS